MDHSFHFDLLQVDSMKSFIAYAEEILDNDNLNEFYDGKFIFMFYVSK